MYVVAHIDPSCDRSITGDANDVGRFKDRLDMQALGYECVEQIPGERATHVIVSRRA